MEILRTAAVALGLLLLGTCTARAEPRTPDPQQLQAAPAPSGAQASATPTPSPAASAGTVNQSSADALRRSIEQAAVYLGSHELRGDEAWMVTQGAMLLGPKFKAWARTLNVAPAVAAAANKDPLKAFPQLLPAEARLWSLRWLPPRKMVALPKPTTEPLAPFDPNRIEQQDVGDLLGMTLLSVACHNLSPDYRKRWIELLSTERYGYISGGQLFALLLGYNQGCLTTNVANPLRRQLVTRLFGQLAADAGTVDHLVIEGMAKLCYAGACAWIDPQVVARLVAEQLPSGSWGRRNPHLPFATAPPETHTAAPAFYVLAQWWSLHHASGNPIGPTPPRVK
jgi:hypothetical protein